MTVKREGRPRTWVNLQEVLQYRGYAYKNCLHGIHWQGAYHQAADAVSPLLKKNTERTAQKGENISTSDNYNNDKPEPTAERIATHGSVKMPAWPATLEVQKRGPFQKIIRKIIDIEPLCNYNDARPLCRKASSDGNIQAVCRTIEPTKL